MPVPPQFSKNEKSPQGIRTVGFSDFRHTAIPNPPSVDRNDKKRETLGAEQSRNPLHIYPPENLTTPKS